MFSALQPPFASGKQVVRRSTPAYGSRSGPFIHHLHDRGHAFRVGDIAVDGEAAPGLGVPTISNPIIPWDLTWQTDGQTTGLGLTLFELLGWQDETMEFIFLSGFEHGSR